MIARLALESARKNAEVALEHLKTDVDGVISEAAIDVGTGTNDVSPSE
ncbi:hypothetical protein [Gordonia sp. CPCC 205333]